METDTNLHDALCEKCSPALFAVLLNNSSDLIFPPLVDHLNFDGLDAKTAQPTLKAVLDFSKDCNGSIGQSLCNGSCNGFDILMSRGPSVL